MSRLPTRPLVALLGSLAFAAPSPAQNIQGDDILVVRYICDGGSKSTVEAYRPSTGQRVLLTPGGTQGCWEGVNGLPSGGFAVGRKLPSGVNLFGPNGVMTLSFPTPESAFTSDVGVFSDGSLAVVDLLTADVERYSSTGQSLGNVSASSLLSPWGCFVDAADVLWVADNVSFSLQTGAVVRFDKNGAWLNTFPLPVQCDDLVVAPDGTMWTVGQSNGTAYHFQADGTLLSSFPAVAPGDVYGITMLSDGSLVFASAGLPDLYHYDPNGSLLGTIPLVPGGPSVFRLGVVANAQWKTVGDGLLGSAGVPALAGVGSLQPGAVTQLTLTGAAAGSASVLIVGAQRVDLPLFGGILVPSADLLLQPIPTGPSGTWTLAGVWPAGVPAGTKVWFQAWIPDPFAVQGYAASPGLEATAQ